MWGCGTMAFPAPPLPNMPMVTMENRHCALCRTEGRLLSLFTPYIYYTFHSKTHPVLQLGGNSLLNICTRTCTFRCQIISGADPGFRSGGEGGGGISAGAWQDTPTCSKGVWGLRPSRFANFALLMSQNIA